MPDYHADDMFRVDSNTFSEEGRSAVTTALMDQLEIKTPTDGVVNLRASIPEVTTEHMSGAYEPRVSQRDNRSR